MRYKSLPLITIAEHLGDVSLEGDPDTEISGVAGLAEAGPGRLSFFANPRYTGALAATQLTDYGQPADEDQVWSIWHGNARVKR